MEKNPEGESCANCVYSLVIAQAPSAISASIAARAGGKEVKLMKCRRFPPFAFPVQVSGGSKLATPDNPNGMQMGSIAVWPDVAETQWCGEWATEEIEPGLTGSEAPGKGDNKPG